MLTNDKAEQYAQSIKDAAKDPARLVSIIDDISAELGVDIIKIYRTISAAKVSGESLEDALKRVITPNK